MAKKLKIGWFSFSCCEDSTIVFIDKGSLQYSELPGISDDDSDTETINTYEPDSSKHIWKKLRTLNENLHSNNVAQL